MPYTITWGAIITGGPTWTPMAPPAPTGFLFAAAAVGLQLFPSLTPPGWLLSSITLRGKIDETIPFSVSGPAGTVSAVLAGVMDGSFSRSRTGGNFLLLPTHFVAQGKVEIRDAAGSRLYAVPAARLEDNKLMYTGTTHTVKKSGSAANCLLQVGLAYQFHVELDLAMRLAVFRYWGVGPTQGARGAADLAPAGSAGLMAEIGLPALVGAGATASGSDGLATFVPPLVFPP